MADGIIKIKIDVDGKELELTNKDLDKVESSSNKAGSSIKKFAASLGLVAIGAAAFKTLKSSMDDAITRFDTLNKFPKVLQALGVSAEDSERSMAKLSDGIDGLPTKLNDIASTAQRMYTSFGDMDKATDSAIALNNALLGSGSSADQAKRGTEMYLKALQTGKIDMDTWNTLSETMDVGLVKIAESFGFVGKTAKDDLYKALQDGTITLDEFNDALIEVGTGTGIMAKLARENTLGIATSFENLKTAAVRGLVEIIDAFNRMSKAVTGKEIAQNIDGLKRVVYASFKAIASVIDATTPVVVMFANGVKMAIPIVKALSPAIIGLMTAYGAYVVITKASTAIQVASAALKAATTTTVGASAAMSSLTIVQQASTKAAQADMLIRALQNKQITLGTLAIGLLTGKVTLATVAQMAMTAASNALGVAIRFMMGPIGWVIGGIGLLTTGIIALVKWFKRSTEEGQRLASETEELASSTETLTDSVNESEAAYQEQQREIEITARKNSELAESVADLAAKESLSAQEKQQMISQINELNDSMDGLNLAYDEEAQALNVSSEELDNRIQLMAQMDAGIEAQERLAEVTRELVEAEKELEDTIELRKEWDQALKDGSVTSTEYNTAMQELNDTENTLKETKAQLAEQQKKTQAQIELSIEAMRLAVEQGIADQIISYERLPDKMKEVVGELKEAFQDYKESATDMFDTLSDKAELTIDEMTENMHENQRVISEWADNIAVLSERGIDDGLLEYLRQAGPESAGLTKEIVEASDTELKEFEAAFIKGGEVAKEGLATSLGLEHSEIFDALGHLIDGVDTTLRDEIESAGFEDIGIDIVKGQADGIKSGTPEAEKAASDMAKKTTDMTKKVFGIHSPSVVFKGIGGDLTAGLVLGINGGMGDVVKAITDMFTNVERASQHSFKNITNDYTSSVNKLSAEMAKLPVAVAKEMTMINKILATSSTAQSNALNKLSQSYARGNTQISKEMTLMNKIVDASMKAMLGHINKNIPLILGSLRALSGSMPRAFSGLPGQMNSIGRYAMSGLASGIRAGSGSAIAQARNTANQIRATMKSALKIKSPSRVMRDDVGRWIPEGIALGIKENAKSVMMAIDDLSEGLMKYTSPELAIGTSMAVGSRGSNVVKQSTTENKYNNVNFDGLFTGANFHVRDENDIPKLAKELNDYIKKSARGKGVVVF